MRYLSFGRHHALLVVGLLFLALPQAFARDEIRNEEAHYRLEMLIDGKPAAAAPSHDAKVPGTDFHATGSVPCKLGKGQPTTNCDMGVQRAKETAGAWSP
jgi:hypothetical protein